MRPQEARSQEVRPQELRVKRPSDLPPLPPIRVKDSPCQPADQLDFAPSGEPDPATATEVEMAGLDDEDAEVNSGIVDPNDPQELCLETRKNVLRLFFALKVLTSFDSGAYSAVLGIDHGIAESLDLSVVDEGALGSAPFIGNTIGCALAGLVLTRFDAKHAAIASMSLHVLASLALASSPTFVVAMASRIIIGLTLSFVVVYSIVWTDTFAPPSSTAMWMALMNVGVPLGMLTGFMIGGALVPALGISWRAAFLIKAGLFIPVIVLLSSVKPQFINEPPPLEQDQVAAKPALGLLERLRENGRRLAKNPLFLTSIASLTVLYFVITALQVFITPFLRGAPYYASMNTVVFTFGGAAVTAPVAGAICGGGLLDKLGGYQSNLPRAALFSACCALLAAWFGFFSCFMETTYSFIGTLWLTLFFGAATVPASTGILMSSVPSDLRSTASSYANITFNILGYFMGPILCGSIADAVGSLHSAVHIILMLSVVGSIPAALSVHLASTMRIVSDSSSEQSTPVGEDYGPGDMGDDNPPCPAPLPDRDGGEASQP